jgi:diketogulonate reductase-like aldo/keto reductase
MWPDLFFSILTGVCDEGLVGLDLVELSPNCDNGATAPLAAKVLFEAMRQIAKEHRAGPAEVAINWLLKDEDVIPIPGAKTKSQIESNIHATQWRLKKDEISRLTAISDSLELNWDSV